MERSEIGRPGAAGDGMGQSPHQKWRWADSNRRPNNAPDSFLHAYSSFVCRKQPAGRRANCILSSKSWRSLKESLRASGLNDTPGSRHNRQKAGGIYVSAAALAALIDAVLS